jgi:DNA-binding CsgD family transcriptional regulator
MGSAYGIGLTLLRPLALALGDLGEDSAGFLSSLGITERSRPELFVPAPSVDRALEAIATRRADPAFGLTLCRASARNPLGFFGHLVWLSSTLRESLQRAARFYTLVTQRVYLDVEEHPDGTASITQRLRPGAERGTILTEFAAATVALRYEQATQGRFRVRGVTFVHSTAAPQIYEAFFCAPVTFGAPQDRVTIAASALDAQLPFADPHTTAALATHAENLTGPAPATVEARLRALLKSRFALTPQQASLVVCVYSGMRNKEIGAAMGLSEGTVKQYLSRIYEQTGIAGRTELAVLAADLAKSR